MFGYLSVLHTFMFGIQSFIHWVPYFIGIVALLRFARGFLCFIWRNLFRTGHNLQERYGANTWACVTGASDGVGAAMAREVARRGLNVILVARNRSKLESVRDKILTECPDILVDIVIFDMASGFGETPNTLKLIKEKCDEINKRDVSLLAQFAGITEVGGYFDLPPALIRDIIELKCVSYPLITRHVGERMLTRNKRSGIVHCASVASAVESIPHYSVGGCTQKFNTFFMKSLSYEYRDKLDIMALKLGHASTQLTGYDDPDAMGTVLPEEAVAGVLRDLGYEDETFGHWKHDTLWSWIDFVMRYIVPESLQQRFMSNKLQFHKKEITEKMKAEGGVVINSAYYK